MSEPDPPDDGAPPRVTGSIDVQMSDTRLPRVSAPVDPGASGSIDVRLSDPELAATAAEIAEAQRRARARAPSIGAKVVHAAESVTGRVAQAADAIGGTVARAGEAVGDVVGASLSRMPVVPRTRRGRVMARSVIVSFLLVFGWIAVIVGLQLRGARPPDLRPAAEAILIAVRDGKAAEVYDDASIRFQSMVRDRETFVDQMTEMNQTLGRFVEVTTVVMVETSRGPGGRTSRIDLQLEYAKTRTRGSISFRWEDDGPSTPKRWKLLGLAIEVPDAIASNKEARVDRSTARPDEIAELKAAVEGVLMSPIEQVWQDASPAFRQAISLEDLKELDRQRAGVLGPFDRVLDMRKVRLNPGRNAASVVVLLQFQKATITGTFELSRSGDTWQLVSPRLVMPVITSGPEPATLPR